MYTCIYVHTCIAWILSILRATILMLMEQGFGTERKAGNMPWFIVHISQQKVLFPTISQLRDIWLTKQAASHPIGASHCVIFTIVTCVNHCIGKLSFGKADYFAVFSGQWRSWAWKVFECSLQYKIKLTLCTHKDSFG